MAVSAGLGHTDREAVGVGGASRFPLAVLPTPLVRARRLEAALRCPPLYFKRDDMTGFALGGNKVRKLEYLIAEARRQGCDTLITGGGPGSNHCMTTAAAARVAGMACVLVLFGNPPSPPPTAMRLARRFGADLRFTGDDDRSSVDRHLAAVAAGHRTQGRVPYVIPRGGATPTGSLAYAQACSEMAAQLVQQDVDPELLLVATGSCGTQAGLIAGTIACDAAWRVVGASVSRPVAECVARIDALARACTDRLGFRHPRPDEVTVMDARGPGFGLPSESGRRCAALAADTEGILLDPVYTAKALAQVDALRDVTGPIVFWHTGGLASAIADAADPARRPAR